MNNTTIALPIFAQGGYQVRDDNSRLVTGKREYSITLWHAGDDDENVVKTASSLHAARQMKTRLITKYAKKHGIDADDVSGIMRYEDASYGDQEENF